MSSPRCLRCGQSFSDTSDRLGDVHPSLERCYQETSDALARCLARSTKLERESARLTASLSSANRQISDLEDQLRAYLSRDP